MVVGLKSKHVIHVHIDPPSVADANTEVGEEAESIGQKLREVDVE